MFGVICRNKKKKKGYTKKLLLLVAPTKMVKRLLEVPNERSHIICVSVC